MFKQLFNTDSILKRVPQGIEEIENKVIEVLKKIGEEFTEYTWSINTYTDRTHNLREGIGYNIFKDGELLVNEYIPPRAGNFAPQQSRDLAQFVANNREGYVLIVASGAEYGVYVEARGYDVITGGSLVASAYRDRVFDELKKSLKKR